MRSYVCNVTLVCYFAVQMNNTLQLMAMAGLRVRYCLIDLRWLNVWNGCCCVRPSRADRTFACIAACVLEFEACV